VPKKGKEMRQKKESKEISLSKSIYLTLPTMLKTRTHSIHSI